jgi:hypothetical protein
MVEAGEQECGGGVSRRWRKGGWSRGQQLKQARSDCACGTRAAGPEEVEARRPMPSSIQTEFVECVLR